MSPEQSSTERGFGTGLRALEHHDGARRIDGNRISEVVPGAAEIGGVNKSIAARRDHRHECVVEAARVARQNDG